MPTETGKPQMAQNAPVLVPSGAGIWNVEIGDGDFRTYVLVCQAAWQEQPQADAPFTERNFADLARLHPARQRPTAETVRGRIYRLSKAGLVRRERSGRTSWRTYPLVEGRPMPKMQRGEQLAASNLAASELVTSELTRGEMDARWERGQKQLAASKLVTSQQAHGELGARREHTQDEPLVASSLAPSNCPQDLTARRERAQKEQLAASHLAPSGSPQTLTARQEHTEEEQLAARHPAASEPEEDDLGALPEHTQDKPLATSSLVASNLPALQEHTQDEQLATSSLAPSRSTPPVFRSLALSHRNGMSPRQIVRRSVEMPESPDAELPKQEARVYSLSDLVHIRPQDLAPTPVGARTEHTQEEPLATSELATSGSDTDVTARRERAQEESLATSNLAANDSPQTVGARQEHTQEALVASELATSEPEKVDVSARPEHTQEEPLATSNLAASTFAQTVTALRERAQGEQLAASELAISDSDQVVTAREEHTQQQSKPMNSVGARQGHTQDESLATRPLAPSTCPQEMTARREHTQDEPLAASPLATSCSHTHARASVLSGTDLPPSETITKPGGSSAPDSTGDTNARAKGPRPPVLERVQVPEGFEDLAVQLAGLRPQGMNYEGIAECMKNPELTRAWTEHALSTKEAIRNVPAYIRAGVRSGKPPVTDAEKEALQAERRTNPAALAATDYGWDDPALNDWDVSEIFRKPGPSKGKDKYGWGDPDETPPDPYGGPYVH